MLSRKRENHSAATGDDRGHGPHDGDPVSSAEAAHRIANNLSLLVALVRLQRGRLKREGGVMSAADAIRFLDEVAARIETVASLHRLLSVRPGTPIVDFSAYLRELRDMLALALPFGGTLRLEPLDDGCYLSPDHVMPLALIINEAVTNAAKYAHPSGVPVTITIGCRRLEQGALAIEIEDDGVGLPEALDPEQDGGLGFRTMRLLARQIGAELVFDSTPLGLRCIATLPPHMTDGGH